MFVPPALDLDMERRVQAFVIDAVARGLRNRQIAGEFGISEETVKKHLATIYGKLAINGRVALAVHGLRGGLQSDARAA